MNSQNYSKKVMRHFENPRNIGEIKDADGIGEVGNLRCGDVMKISIKVKDEIIKDIKFKTFGCVAAISTSSILTEIVKGKTIKQAKKITKDSIIQELGGLPTVKVHCSLLAIDALKAAIKDYENKIGVKK